MPLTLEEFVTQLTTAYATEDWLATLPDAELAQLIEAELWVQVPPLSRAHALLGEVLARLRRTPEAR
jgi:hypothetical protein